MDHLSISITCSTLRLDTQACFNTLTCLTRSKQDQTKAILQNKYSIGLRPTWTRKLRLTTDLTSQTNHQSKHLERQSEGRQLKFEGNKDQFLFNAELQEHIEISSGLLKQADISGALEKLETAQRPIHNCQKAINLADKSEAGGSLLKNTRPRISQL